MLISSIVFSYKTISMRVIIPAAGRGTRLQPLTLFSPKCMVDINGKPLLYYLLITLKHFAIDEVVLVTGYKSDMIEDYISGKPEFPAVKFIHNDQFDKTNSIVSLSLTRHLWDTDFCIIDSDLLIRPKLFADLIALKDTCLVVDNSKDFGEIDMKVNVVNGRLINMDKGLLRKDTNGKFSGISRWANGAAKALSLSIEKFVGHNQTNVWYENAIRDIANDVILPVSACSSDFCCEIDTATDYERAIQFATKWQGEWSI